MRLLPNRRRVTNAIAVSVVLGAVASFVAVGTASAASVSAASGGAATATEKATATLTIIEPGVSVQRKDKDVFKPATDGQKLRVGDTVKTDASGFVQVNYTDDSFTRLDVNTTFTIVSLTDDEGNRKIKSSLETGRTWNRTSALSESESFEQEGAGATAAVVGSAYFVTCVSANSCVYIAVDDFLQVTTMDGEVQLLDPLERCGSTEVSDTDADLCSVPEAVALEVLLADAFFATNYFLDAAAGLPVPVTGIVEVDAEGNVTFTPAEQPPPPPPPPPPAPGPEPACGTAPTNPPIHFDGSPGTAAPPSTLGTCAMTAFGDDTRPDGEQVSNVPAPGGGSITFDQPLTHVTVGAGWSTWSHGYTGDVYYLPEGGTMTLTLPANTFAFSFYAEPNTLSVFNITATEGSGTTSGPVPVDGNGGASYFGFYSTSSGSPLLSITITTDEPSGSFAIGEFTINQEPVVLSASDAVTAPAEADEPEPTEPEPTEPSPVAPPETEDPAPGA